MSLWLVFVSFLVSLTVCLKIIILLALNVNFLSLSASGLL